MNITCRDAYAIYCENFKNSTSETIHLVLDMITVYKNKNIISHCELNILSMYIFDCISKIKLSVYQLHLILKNVIELNITDQPGNKEIMNFIYYTLLLQRDT